MTRRILLALMALGAVVLVLGSTVSDLHAPFGIGAPPGPRISLSGQLWRDRTISSEDGTLDIGIVAADEPLTIRVDAPPPHAIVELHVDGRLDDSACLCNARRSDPAVITVTPRLTAATLGRRRIDVKVRDARSRVVGDAAGSATLHVDVVPRLPATREVEPGRLRSAVLPRSTLPARSLRTALRVLRTARGRPPLASLLGRVGIVVREAGRLQDGGRAVGATLLVALRAPRSDVVATVPALAQGLPRGPMPAPLFRLRARRLRDLLIDVDLVRRRVVAVEPGPGSAVAGWQAVDVADGRRDEDLALAAPAVAHAPRTLPILARLSDHGPAFLAYDGDATLDSRRRDWPVSLVFVGHASITKVKRALRAVGLSRTGESRYLPYRLASGGQRFDGDRGLKTACDANATDVHLRLYAPGEADRFSDPDFGGVVVATAHLDRADGCGTGPKLFGFSEDAERRVAALARRLGWRVDPGVLPLGNDEPYRRDVRDPGHVWLGDGRATVIHVP